MASVIIAEDSSYISKKLELFFVNEMQWLVAGKAHNGIEAVEMYKDQRPDLMTIDLSLPKKSGDKVIEEIIGEFPDAKILVISVPRRIDFIRSLSLGAAGYIEKPLKFESREYMEEFKRTLEEVVQPGVR